MSKAQWKQPALKQAEKKVADREQAIQEAKFWREHAEAARNEILMLKVERDDAVRKINDLKGRAGGYDYLRSLGVVVMGDEPKHLQGEDMDKYIERHTWNDLGTKYGRALAKSMAATKSQLTRQVFDSFWLANHNAGAFKSNKQSIAGMVLDEATDNLAMHIDEHIKFKSTGRYNIGSNTGSESKEADQKDSGHYTDILRYAYRYGVRK